MFTTLQTKLNAVRAKQSDNFRDTLIYDAHLFVQGRKDIKKWTAEGCPVPPPHALKRKTISAYQRKFGLSTLVETGTFKGDMVYAMRRKFTKIISIELDSSLYAHSRKRLAGYPHIEVLLGDSAELLPVVLQSLKEPALFWLDGHYSGPGTGKGDAESPILLELEAVLRHKVTEHVVLIDDAREFVGTRGYPTLDSLRDLVAKVSPGSKVEVVQDIVRIIPTTIVETL